MADDIGAREMIEAVEASMTDTARDGLVGYRWRYVREGDLWHLRRTPIFPSEANQWFCAVEVEPVYSAARIEKLEARHAEDVKRNGELEEALEFYADPESYHAVMILGDRPCGLFAEDFDDQHGHEDYDRPMPGSLARAALNKGSK